MRESMKGSEIVVKGALAKAALRTSLWYNVYYWRNRAENRARTLRDREREYQE